MGMNKVLIMSDSHGLTAEINEIKKRHQITHMIHCGDSELSSEHESLDDLIIVRGNCDFDNTLKQDISITIEGIRFFITHGHLYDVRASLLRLAYKGAEENAQVICYGHTHVCHVEKLGDQLFINPGSIRLPRGYPEKTYVIMEWDTPSLVAVNFFDVNGKLIEELSFTTTLY